MQQVKTEQACKEILQAKDDEIAKLRALIAVQQQTKRPELASPNTQKHIGSPGEAAAKAKNELERLKSELSKLQHLVDAGTADEPRASSPSLQAQLASRAQPRRGVRLLGGLRCGRRY